MRAIMQGAAAAGSFRGKALMNEVALALPRLPRLREGYLGLTRAVESTPLADAVLAGLVRWSFFIELVKTPKIETTKFETRWGDRLDTQDPRWATYDECLEMCCSLLESGADALGDPQRRAVLLSMLQRRLLPYELPIDYQARRLGSRIHVPDNVEWLWEPGVQAALLLRVFLLDAKADGHLQTFVAAYDKVRVKTYLTDRVLTGAHKTNREKRWETHPDSVHFALRRDCLEIERALVVQLCNFANFPSDLHARLDAAHLLTGLTPPFRCPVTLDPLSFPEFEAEIANPTAGKSSFQVGHLNPLKATIAGPYSGHTVGNISWVSADGNRIQGPLSLEATRELVRRMVRNYEALGEA